MQKKERKIRMMLQAGILIVGFLFLVKGADWFVEGSASIARKFGIPQLIIGLTIVAMGTSMPEAAVSITAAMQQNAGITIGNVVGSNILNIFIILGLTALITNVAIQRSTLFYEIPFMMFVTVVLMICGMTGGKVTFAEGIVLWVLFLVYLGYLFVMSKKGENPEEEEAKNYPVWKCLLLMVAGGILVVKGSDFAVSGATEIARYFGMSERFIGLTIVALGTSLPELVTSVTAAKRGNAGIAIGNIVGSNIFNILFVIGTAALILIIYIAFRFKQISGWSAGVCAVLGLLSTLIVTYGCVVLCRFEIDSNFMAVILTLLGYAVNDTIVIYDRIRENQTLLPGIQIRDLVNISDSQSLRRSIRTSVTTFSSMLVVTIVALIMGLDSILSFSIPMMAGIAMGTFNSICFVPSLWVWWQTKRGITVLKPAKKKAKTSV